MIMMCGCELQRVFRELDANNDGFFNSYELRNALNSVGMSQLLLLLMMMMMTVVMMLMVIMCFVSPW